MTAGTPERADVGEPPALYARWWRDVAGASDDAIGSAWRMTFPADRKFWTELDAKLAALAPQPAPGCTVCAEVGGPHGVAKIDEETARVLVVLGWTPPPLEDAKPEPQPAPEVPDLAVPTLATAMREANRLSARLVALRELLDDIGVMAANATEDGDSFGLLEQIAFLVAAVDMPDSTPLDDWPDPENPVTGRTPGAAASIESEADEMRAVIDMIWRMCQRAERAAGTSQGADIGGERLAARIASLIKNSEMEPF